MNKEVTIYWRFGESSLAAGLDAFFSAVAAPPRPQNQAVRLALRMLDFHSHRSDQITPEILATCYRETYVLEAGLCTPVDTVKGGISIEGQTLVFSADDPRDHAGPTPTHNFPRIRIVICFLTARLTISGERVAVIHRALCARGLAATWCLGKGIVSARNNSVLELLVP